VNEDTEAVFEALQNDECLYLECERAARLAAVGNDEQDFRAELAESLRRITEDNRQYIPDFSNTDPIEYHNVDYDDIASLYRLEDYE